MPPAVTKITEALGYKIVKSRNTIFTRSLAGIKLSITNLIAPIEINVFASSVEQPMDLSSLIATASITPGTPKTRDHGMPVQHSMKMVIC